MTHLTRAGAMPARRARSSTLSNARLIERVPPPLLTASICRRCPPAKCRWNWNRWRSSSPRGSSIAPPSAHAFTPSSVRGTVRSSSVAVAPSSNGASGCTCRRALFSWLASVAAAAASRSAFQPSSTMQKSM